MIADMVRAIHLIRVSNEECLIERRLIGMTSLLVAPRRLVICLFTFSSFCTPLLAQEFAASFKPVYGSYRMGDMHTLQQQQYSNIFDSLRTKAKEVYKFPSYWGANANACFSFKRHTISLQFAYATTGGRLHYEDYSGLIKVDKRIAHTSLGIGYGYRIINKKRLHASTAVTLGRANSTLKTNDHVQIYVSDEESTSVGSYTSRQMLITPELRMQYYFLKFFFAEASAGYSLQLSSTAQQDHHGAALVDSNGNVSHLDWSGARLGIGLGFSFNVKE